MQLGLRSAGVAGTSRPSSTNSLLPVSSRVRTVARSYNVDVETDRPRAPDNAPRWGGAPPPPPPPPPPAAKGLQPPSRRELLFGFLGAGLGALGTAAFYNRPVSDADLDERLAAVLDDLLDDEDLLNLVGEEILFNQQLRAQEGGMDTLAQLKEIDDDLAALQQKIAASNKDK